MAFSAPWHNNNPGPSVQMMDIPMMTNVPPPGIPLPQPPQMNFMKPNPEEMMVIDKMSEYIVRNPPEFFNKIYENKKNDPKFFFLNQGHPHHMYFQWKLNQLKMNPMNHDFFQPQPGPGPGPNMMCMPPNGFPPPNGQIPQTYMPPQDSLNLEIKLFNNFTKIDCKEFIDTLELITKNCSQVNIQRGSKWVFEHCSSPIFIDYLAPLLIKYTQTKSLFKEKLHVTYLINDLLFHCENKQKIWIRERFCNHLIPLFNMIYHSFILSKEDSDSLYKIISIWENQKYFDIGFINALRTGMIAQQPMISQPPIINAPAPSLMIPQMMTQPPPSLIPTQPAPLVKKKYYELPAGLSVIGGWSESPYTPLKIEKITEPYQCKQPTNELLKAIDDFYIGLNQQKKLLNNEKEDEKNKVENIIDQNVPEIVFEKDGWEKGFLDFLYEDRRKQREKEKKRNKAKYKSYNKSRSRSRGRSRNSRSRSKSRERKNSNSSRSRSRRRSRSRSSRSSRSRSNSSSSRSSRSRSSRSRSRSRSSDDRKHRGSSHNEKNKRKDHYRSNSRDKSLSSRSRSTSRSRHSKSHSRSKSYHRKYSYSSSESDYHSRDRSHSRSRSRGRNRERSRSRSRSRNRKGIDDKNDSKDDDMDGFPLSMSMADNFMMGSTGSGLGMTSTIASETDRNSGLNENNIGFQMMKKLGWSGTGLGKEGKGIIEPIKGGEIRTQENKYIGIGVNSTPPQSSSTFGLSDDKFEEYRKSKSYTYSRDPSGRRRRDTIGCYRCGKHGHIARDCQELGW